MSPKKLSLKKSKDGKLKIHKNGEGDEPTEVEQVEAEMEGHEDPPFESDEEDPPKKKKKKKKTKQGEKNTAAVVVSQTGKPDIVQEEELEIVHEESSVGSVGFSLRRTLNLGDFESLQVSVSINVPTRADVEEFEGNYEFAKEWAEGKMQEAVEEYES